MPTQNIDTTTMPTTPATITKIACPKFVGKYADEQAKYWENSQKLFGFSPEMAEKFANHLANDTSTALLHGKGELKFGKVNKDNKGTIADTTKAKGVSYTNSMNLAHTMGHIDEMGKHGILWSQGQPWRLVEALTQYCEILAQSCHGVSYADVLRPGRSSFFDKAE